MGSAFKCRAHFATCTELSWRFKLNHFLIYFFLSFWFAGPTRLDSSMDWTCLVINRPCFAFNSDATSNCDPSSFFGVQVAINEKKIPWLKTWTELMVMTTCVYFQVLVSITQRSPPTGKGSTIHVWCICKGQCDFRRNSSTNCASIRDIKAKRWKKKDQKKKKEKKIGKENWKRKRKRREELSSEIFSGRRFTR